MKRNGLFSSARTAVHGEDTAGRAVAMLAGVGLGAGAMYFFDPRTGRRRRALLNDQLTHVRARMEPVPRIVGRDLRHRASGLWTECTR